MAQETLVEIAIILVLILLNGLFALSEMAVVSSRHARLVERAQAGARGYAQALDLAESPGRFLSTVQVGITLVGVLLGAIGGTTLAARLEVWVQLVPALARYSHGLSLGIVVVGITYLSLLLGELAPKRLALNDPERTAARISGGMGWLSRVASPIVRFLSASSDLVLWLVGAGGSAQSPVTEDEIRLLLKEGAEAGTFEATERDLVGRIFKTTDRRVGSLATPRTEIAWLDVEDPDDETSRRISGNLHGWFPVCRGHLDEVLGIVQAKDLLSRCLAGRPLNLLQAMSPATFVPESMRALEVLEAFRDQHVHIALVMDEYGGVQGMLTTSDLLEALVGEIPEPGEQPPDQAVRQEDGSWLIDGMLAIDDFKVLFDLRSLPDEERGIYETVAGFVIMILGHLPRLGETVNWHGLGFQVAGMDGHRIQKLRVTPANDPTARGRWDDEAAED